MYIYISAHDYDFISDPSKNNQCMPRTFSYYFAVQKGSSSITSNYNDCTVFTVMTISTY